MSLKYSNRCGNPTNSVCVSFDLDVPESSELNGEDCLNIEQTTEDLYNRTEDINTQIDLSELGQECLTYVEDEEGRTVVKNVLLEYESQICTLKQEVENLKNGLTVCSSPLTGCSLNFRGLVDECNNPPQTIAELLQIIIDTIAPQ